MSTDPRGNVMSASPNSSAFQVFRRDGSIVNVSSSAFGKDANGGNHPFGIGRIVGMDDTPAAGKLYTFTVNYSGYATGHIEFNANSPTLAYIRDLPVPPNYGSYNYPEFTQGGTDLDGNLYIAYQFLYGSSSSSAKMWLRDQNNNGTWVTQGAYGSSSGSDPTQYIMPHVEAMLGDVGGFDLYWAGSAYIRHYASGTQGTVPGVIKRKVTIPAVLATFSQRLAASPLTIYVRGPACINATTVKVDGVVCPFTRPNSPDELLVTIPVAAAETYQSVQVIGPTRTVYTDRPLLRYPTIARTVTPYTIRTGTNISVDASSSYWPTTITSIKIGGVPATNVVRVSAYKLTCTVPDGVALGLTTVTINDTISLVGAATVVEPGGGFPTDQAGQEIFFNPLEAPLNLPLGTFCLGLARLPNGNILTSLVKHGVSNVGAYYFMSTSTNVTTSYGLVQLDDGGNIVDQITELGDGAFVDLRSPAVDLSGGTWCVGRDATSGPDYASSRAYVLWFDWGTREVLVVSNTLVSHTTYLLRGPALGPLNVNLIHTGQVL